MRGFGVNVMIAVIWLLLATRPSVTMFAIGFMIGFALVALFRKVIGAEPYVRRSIAFLFFLATFVREFVFANVKVAWIVLFRSRQALHPNFVTIDINGLRPTEALLLSYCILLTPGTTTVRIEDNFRTIIVHALNAAEPERLRNEVEYCWKRTILNFTR